MTTRQLGPGAAAVTFRDVVKVYHPDIRALDHVTFDIHRGETVALLGPNGAGKSTAIDTMLGLRAPTSGKVLVLGDRPAAAVAAGRDRRPRRLPGGETLRRADPAGQVRAGPGGRAGTAVPRRAHRGARRRG